MGEIMNCKYCGAPLDSIVKSSTKCSYCEKINYFSLEGESSFNSEDFYQQLEEAAAINKIQDLKKYSSIINDKSKGSFASKYFEVYADYRLKNRNEVIHFLDTYNGEILQEDSFAIDHLIQHGELKDKKVILRFLKRKSPYQLKNYHDVYNKRTKQEDNYAKVPRDVFICFSSSNLIIANQIVKMLEAESISCWIASRNLREQGISNYWEDILSAIDRAKILVLVSSESEMNSADVAKELDYANEISKRIVEFKIDLTPHNLTFKHLFSGNRWVDATGDIDKGYIALKTRIFNELKQIQKATNIASDTTRNIEKPKKTQVNNQKVVYGYYSVLAVIIVLIALGIRLILPSLDIELITFDIELLLP
jgi:hypothetical protein